MSQTSIIAAGLVVAWLVFVTVRNELPCYLQVLGISSSGGSCPSGTAPSGTTPSNTASAENLTSNLLGEVTGVGGSNITGTGPSVLESIWSQGQSSGGSSALPVGGFQGFGSQDLLHNTYADFGN